MFRCWERRGREKGEKLAKKSEADWDHKGKVLEMIWRLISHNFY